MSLSMQLTPTELAMVAHVDNAIKSIRSIIREDLKTNNMLVLERNSRSYRLLADVRDEITNGYSGDNESVMFVVNLLYQVVTQPIKTKTIKV